MSVEEIDRRLEDRFALLRGGDRSAPDRHQTLLAVIEWSWNLLDAAEQRALRRLALFHDGFTLEAAEARARRRRRRRGPRPGRPVAAERPGDRRRGAVPDAGDGARVRPDAARAGRRGAGGARRPARLGRRLRDRAAGAASPARTQFAAIDALARRGDQPGRRAARRDRRRGPRRAWSSCSPRSGCSGRCAASTCGWSSWPRRSPRRSAAGSRRRSWRTPTRAAVGDHLEQHDDDRRCERTARCWSLLRQLGPGPGGNPHLPRLVRVLLAYDPADPRTARPMPTALGARSLGDRRPAAPAAAASQWLGHERENAGDPAGAIEAAQRVLALVRDEDGPWASAMPHGQLAELAMHIGDRGAAVEHARRPAGDAAAGRQRRRDAAAYAAGALRDRRGAARGRGGRAARDGPDRRQARRRSAGLAFRQVGRAELALAPGDSLPGWPSTASARSGCARSSFPGVTRTGREPWALFGDAMALSAHAHYAAGDDVAHGQALFRVCRTARSGSRPGERRTSTTRPRGWCCSPSAPGACCAAAGPAEDALRLLALADRFAYSRTIPTLTLGADRRPGRGSSARPARPAAGRVPGPRRRRTCWTRPGWRWSG